MKKGDVICRCLHTLEPTDLQAFIDRLSIVERHRLRRALNVRLYSGQLINQRWPYDTGWLQYLLDTDYASIVFSTGTTGQGDN
jgi:hypothetical protein